MTDAVKLLTSPLRSARGGGAGQGPAEAAQYPLRSGGPTAAETVLRDRLRLAERAARAGHQDTARWLCAGAILDHQPLLLRSMPLLRETVVALLYSQAFGQIARLLDAVQGRRVRVRAGGAAAPAHSDETEATEDYVLDPAWFVTEAGERIIHDWVAVLVAGPSRHRANRLAETGSRWSVRH